jgi:hypothetical protein
MPPRVFGLRMAPDEMVICVAPKEEPEPEQDEEEAVEPGFRTPQTGRPSRRPVMQNPVTGYKCDNCYFYSCPCLNCAPRQDDLHLTWMSYDEFRDNPGILYPENYQDFVYYEDILQGWIIPEDQTDAADSSEREKHA